jgi:hypothetical protein
MKTYQGGCHCGAVRYQVEADLQQGTGRCNCSYCRKVRAWGTAVKPEQFTLISGEDHLVSYRFGSQAIEHPFCKTCGVRSFLRGNIEQVGGAFVSVQVATLDIDDEELASLPVQHQDGRSNSWWTPPKVTSYL